MIFHYICTFYYDFIKKHIYINGAEANVNG